MVYRDPRSGRQFGDALQQWREQSEITLTEAADHCGVPVTHLLDVENGKCGPSAAVLRNLATIYGDAPEVEREGWALVLCWLEIFTQRQAKTNRERLMIVADSLRELRSLGPKDRVRMRDVEGDIIVSMLDTEARDLMYDMMAAFSLSAFEAKDILSGSLRRIERRKGAHEPIISRIAATGNVDAPVVTA